MKCAQGLLENVRKHLHGCAKSSNEETPVFVSDKSHLLRHWITVWLSGLSGALHFVFLLQVQKIAITYIYTYIIMYIYIYTYTHVYYMYIY